MTDKPMTPREDVEAITVTLEVCAGLNKEVCRISNNTIEHTVTMLRALLAERDAAYRRGQEDMREAAIRIVGDLPAEESDEVSKALWEWRPIESAPKDGRKFLTWDKVYGIRIGRAFIRANHDDWLSYCDGFNGSSKGGARATHWMPLPQAPERDDG